MFIYIIYLDVLKHQIINYVIFAYLGTFFGKSQGGRIFFAESLADIYQRNVLTTKNKEFQQKAAALQADAKIKSEFDYFKFQSEQERLQTDSSGNRLPASLDDP